MARLQRRLKWDAEADRRLDEKLTDAFATDAWILAGKPPLDWLLEMRTRYRNIFERSVDPIWQLAPELRERYRKELAESDKRWREVERLAEEQLAEHAKRGVNGC